MSDFITISCPSCGGQLQRGSNTSTYTCDYCGQQHRLRQEDIEEFGRCPVCRRNDKVEKVRAIFYKKSTLSSRLASPSDPTKSLSYKPNQKPDAGPRPSDTSPNSVQTELGPYVLMFAVFFFLIFYIFDKGAVGTILFLALLFAGITLMIVGKSQDKQVKQEHKRLISEWESRHDKIEADWVEYIEAYEKDFNQEYALLTAKHVTAMQRYEQLYYCHRDDIVFIPGESGHAPSGMLEEFLYKSVPEK